MITIKYDKTQEEFDALDVLNIVSETHPEGVNYVKKDFVLSMSTKFIKQLLFEKRISIMPGQEDYFKTLFADEPQGNSPATDGTGLPGLDQGKVQGDSEVQQGDDGEGSGPAGSEREAESFRGGFFLSPDTPDGDL